MAIAGCVAAPLWQSRGAWPETITSEASQNQPEIMRSTLQQARPAPAHAATRMDHAGATIRRDTISRLRTTPAHDGSPEASGYPNAGDPPFQSRRGVHDSH